MLELNQHELEWLSNHIGHELEIHKEVYRLHESTLEASKVSKLLLALEEGSVVNLKGKTLSEISESGKCLYLTFVLQDGKNSMLQGLS